MNFVVDLAIILMAAGVFTVISKALKQPLILGYIIAGFLVGPHLGLVTITSQEGVEQWSEIGIIFLLFALGLEFSFKKLVKVGSSALVTAGVKCVGMFAVGILVGDLMGWTSMEGIFLGGLLSMSSTTIIIKAYDDMGLKNRPHSTLLFGSLVFEDLIAVLLMVLLSTMAASNHFEGGEMLKALARLLFFLILWFVVGIYLIPLILKKVNRFLNDEIILIIAIGLCFAMVAFAEAVGFSSALGAFVMGSILAETTVGERMEHAVSKIKDLFGAIFFVSVGMMVDPAVIGEHWLPIIIITLAAMLGILIFSTTGALLMGQGLKNAVHIGFSLSQLGEFAFIIAGLGCSLGVLREFIYPVVVTVSVLTTFTTPYMIKAADPVSDWLCRVLPPKWVLQPSTDEHNDQSAAASHQWGKLLKSFSIRLVIYVVITLTVLFLAKSFLLRGVEWLLPNVSAVGRGWIVMGIVFVLLVPFVYSLSVNDVYSKEMGNKLIRENKHFSYLIRVLVLVKVLASAVLLTAVFVFAPVRVSPIVMTLFLVAMALLLLWARRSKRKYAFFDDTFIENLNEKERAERAARPVTTALQDSLQNYDVHVECVEILPEFDGVGKTLREMPFRHVVDVAIVELMRGSLCIRIPRGDEHIYPYDKLLAAGTTEQLRQFRDIIAEHTGAVSDHKAAAFDVRRITIEQETDIMNGKTLRQLDLRASGCLVVGLLRGNNLMSNPGPEERLLLGDTLWLAGETSSLDFWQG